MTEAEAKPYIDRALEHAPEVFRRTNLGSWLFQANRTMISRQRGRCDLCKQWPARARDLVIVKFTNFSSLPHLRVCRDIEACEFKRAVQVVYR